MQLVETPLQLQPLDRGALHAEFQLQPALGALGIDLGLQTQGAGLIGLDGLHGVARLPCRAGAALRPSVFRLAAKLRPGSRP